MSITELHFIKLNQHSKWAFLKSDYLWHFLKFDYFDIKTHKRNGKYV